MKKNNIMKELIFLEREIKNIKNTINSSPQNMYFDNPRLPKQIIQCKEQIKTLKQQLE